MRPGPVTQPSLGGWLRAHRLAVGIIAGVILLCGGYIIWSKYTWDGYHRGHTQWHSSMRSQIDTALALPATTDKERTAKLAALEETSETVNTAKNSLCTITQFVSWQRFIQSLGSSEEQCQQIVRRAVAFNDKMQAVTHYLEHSRTLAQTITQVPVKTELAEADWEAQAAAVHDMTSKVDKLAVNTDFTPVKQIAGETLKKVDVAWQEVLAAHKAKDKVRYLKAQSQLVAAYGSIGNISDASTKGLKSLIDSLQVAYKEAFK